MNSCLGLGEKAADLCVEPADNDPGFQLQAGKDDIGETTTYPDDPLHNCNVEIKLTMHEGVNPNNIREGLTNGVHADIDMGSHNPENNPNSEIASPKLVPI